MLKPFKAFLKIQQYQGPDQLFSWLRDVQKNAYRQSSCDWVFKKPLVFSNNNTTSTIKGTTS